MNTDVFSGAHEHTRARRHGAVTFVRSILAVSDTIAHFAVGDAARYWAFVHVVTHKVVTLHKVSCIATRVDITMQVSVVDTMLFFRVAFCDIPTTRHGDVSRAAPLCDVFGLVPNNVVLIFT